MPKPSFLLAPLYVLALFLVGYPTSAFAIIFGEDDRLEHFEVNRRYKEYARSIAVIASGDSIERDGNNYRWKLDQIYTLGEIEIDGRQVSPDERFVNQPLCGSGTAFLIAPDVIVTAGHCIMNLEGEITIRDKYIVFDYHINPTTQSVDEQIPAENIYRCVDAEVIEYDGGAGRDFAIVRLDRPVEGRTPLEVRQDGRIEDRTRLVQIGHPLGLPLKVAINARVQNNGPTQYFLGNIDSFPGNSGSPILDARTGVVEGILVRSVNADEDDHSAVGYADTWRINAITDLLEVRRLEDAEADELGCHVQRINLIPEIAGGFARGLALFAMIAEGKTEEVLAELENGADTNLRGSYNRHLLHQAMRHSNIELARALIDLEVPILIRDDNDDTPLHEAARAGFTEGAVLLIEYDHPINVINKAGETPLWVVNRMLHNDLADTLTEEGADANIIPIALAHYNSSDKGYEASQELWWPVVSEDDAATTALYLQYGVSIEITGEILATDYQSSLLHWAAESDAPSIATLLIECGADVDAENSFGNTPLSIAAGNNSQHTFALLLQHRASIDESVLEACMFRNDASCLRIALDQGPHIEDEAVVNLLMQAKYHDAIKPAELLIESGIDVNAIDASGYSALGRLTLGDTSDTDIALATLLLENGAQVDLGNLEPDGDPGSSPLHLAAGSGSSELISLLLEYGADVNYVCRYDTALDEANDRGNYDVSILLREAGGKTYRELRDR